MPALGIVETAAWCLAIALLVAMYANAVGGPALENDSYQYISVAENFRLTPAARTSIVYFDTERSHGVIPAPLTTFPPAYPFLMAALSYFGATPDYAGLILSTFAACSVLILLVWSARWLDLGPWTTRTVLALLVTNSTFVIGSAYVLTEPLFTAASLAALLCLLRSETSPASEHSQLTWLVLAQLLIGLTYWIRYAGLFLFVAVAAYLAMRVIVERGRRSWLALGTIAISALLIGIGLIRNHLLVATWKGGNTKLVRHDALPVIQEFFSSIYHVLLGEAAPAGVVLETMVALAGVAIIALVARPLYQSRGVILGDKRLHVLGTFVGVYVAAMIYLGTRSVISFGPRMFKPLLPMLLLFGAIAYRHVHGRLVHSRQSRAVIVSAFVALFASYALINLRNYLSPPAEQRHLLVSAELNNPLDNGESLAGWIGRNIPADRALVATDGQATGYLLKRGIVSLTSSEYSDQAWTAESVRATMKRFDANWLVIYYGLRDVTPVIQQSAFLLDLSRGSIPGWLRVVADNHRVRVFALADSHQTRGNDARGYL